VELQYLDKHSELASVPLKRHGFAFWGTIKLMNIQKIKSAAKKLNALSDQHGVGTLSDREFLEKLSNFVEKSGVYPMLSELSSVVCSCGMIVDCYGSDDHSDYAALAKNAKTSVANFVKGDWKSVVEVLRFSYGYKHEGKVVRGVSGQVSGIRDDIRVACQEDVISVAVQAVIDRGMKGKYALVNVQYLLPEEVEGWVLMDSDVTETSVPYETV
jgi:hypothetical protein